MSRENAIYPPMAALLKKLQLPMLLLCFVWLGILISGVAFGESRAFLYVGTGIWILFILYFIVHLVTVTNRIAFLKKNWLFVLALLVSVLRFFPVLQSLPLVHAMTATFGMQVIWMFASADQGMRSLRRALGHRGSGYALALTVVVILTGAACMLHFEGASDDPKSIHTYLNALWWTAMQMTNIGSSYTITTTGGRILCLGISIYAAVMFGYLTALLATFLIDRDIKDPKPDIGYQKSNQEIHEQIIQLRQVLEEVLIRLPSHTN